MSDLEEILVSKTCLLALAEKYGSGDAPNGGRIVSHGAIETNTTQRSTRACQRRLTAPVTTATNSPAQ